MPDRNELEVVALVTAYNEESTIGTVLDVLMACPSVDRVQVVNDGSTDETAAVAGTRPVTVITLPKRVPVGQAIMHHLTDLEGERILIWCDADLLGLEPNHIETLIRRFRREGVSQSLSSRGLPLTWPSWLRLPPLRWAWKRAFGPLSGERVILQSTFENAIALSRTLNWTEMMRGYGIVLFLNWYAQVYGSGSVITYFDTLRQRQKCEKWGRCSIWEMVGEWKQFILTWIKIRWHAKWIRSLHEAKSHASTSESLVLSKDPE